MSWIFPESFFVSGVLRFPDALPRCGSRPPRAGLPWGPLQLQAPVSNSFPGIPSTLLCVLRTPLQVLLPREALFAAFSLFLFVFCGWGLFPSAGNLGCLLCLKLGDLERSEAPRVSVELVTCKLCCVRGLDRVILSPGLLELVTTPGGFSNLLTGDENPAACVGVESWGFRV